MLKSYAFVTWPLSQGQSVLKIPRILFLNISIHVWLCMYILKKHVSPCYIQCFYIFRHCSFSFFSYQHIGSTLRDIMGLLVLSCVQPGRVRSFLPFFLSTGWQQSLTVCVLLLVWFSPSPAPYLTGSNTFEVVDLFTCAEGPADFPYIFSFLITVSPL